MLPLLGLSLQSLIDKAGAYAGLASLLGLAVLSLLYFAQAREVRRLRDWAGRSPERAQELEERVASQADAARQAAAAPAPTPAARPASAAPAAPAAQVLSPAPAGLAAPALASATRFVPPATPAPTPPRAPAIPADEGVGPVTTVSPAATVAPATAAGARPGPSPRPDVGNGRAQSPPPARTLPPRSPSAPAAVRLSGPPPRRSPRARALALTGALVLVAAAIFGAIQLFGGSDKKAAHKQASTSSPRTGTRGASFNRGSVVTTVLNGTPQAGVAHTVSQRLVRFGFKEGSVTNASDQQRSATSISYFPGHRRDALAVSRALKVSNVAPVDPQTKAIACPQPACATTVVVTVGSDYASGK